MFQILNRKTKFVIFGTLVIVFSFLLVSAKSILGTNINDNSFINVFSTFIIGSSLFYFFICIIATMPWWQRIWAKYPSLNRRIFPDLNGQWKGIIQSNFNIISKTSDELIEKEVTVNIKQNWFRIFIELDSDDKYQSSKTLSSNISRDEEGYFYITYIFASTVPNPKNSDGMNHYGSGKLKVFIKENKITLSGDYWTNRKWREGFNTAGLIELEKIK